MKVPSSFNLTFDPLMTLMDRYVQKAVTRWITQNMAIVPIA